MSENLQKEVIISVKTDTSQAEQDLKGLKDTLDDVGNTPVDKAVKSLKQQLKEAKRTAMELQAAGKMDTKEYQDAIKLIAKMKDEQEVLNRTVQSFDPGNKMSAFINIAKTATSAISGVAGAMTLFGVESEKAQQTIAQLQGLMALKDAIGDIGDFWKAYSLRVSAAKTETVAMGNAQKGQAAATNVATVATKGLGMAFKALGIGLLISAVAYLISNWESLRDSLVKVFPALKDMGSMFDKVKQIAMGVGNVLLQHVVAPIKAIVKAVKGDFSGAMEEIKNGFNVVKNFNAGANAELSRQNDAAAKDRLTKDIENREKNLEVLKASGKETYAYERKMLQDSLKLYEDDKEKKDEINQKIRVLDASHQKQLADQRKQADDKAAQERKQAAEKAKQQLEEEHKTLKQHLEAVQKIEDDATKAIAQSKLNDKDKELYNIADQFKAQETELKRLYADDLKVLDDQLKRKAITQSEYNKEFENLQKQHNETHLALVEKKGADDVEVEKKYNKILSEFIDSYQTSQFEQQKAKLIQAFDEKIALADGKQKELLEKMKDEQVQKLVTQETLRKETVSKETVLYDVKAENMALPTDDTQTSLEKMQNIWKAEQELKDAQRAEEIAKLNGNEEQIALIKAKWRLQDTEDEKAHSEARKEIMEKEAEAKTAMMETIGNAANVMSDIIGKNTVAGKALAIAATTIDTYMAAQKAYASQMALTTPDAPVRATIAAAAAVLQGLARVKAILSVKVPAKSGDASASSAPIAMTAPTITQTQLNPEQYKVQDVRVVNQNAEPIKAYITQSDLKDNQEKQEFFNKLSSI